MAISCELVRTNVLIHFKTVIAASNSLSPHVFIPICYFALGYGDEVLMCGKNIFDSDAVLMLQFDIYTIFADHHVINLLSGNKISAIGYHIIAGQRVVESSAALFFTLF